MASRALAAYRRSPSALHLPGDTRLLTLRLVESIPAGALAELQHQFGPAADAPHADADLRKRYFAAWDAVLGRAASGPTWLRTNAIARLIRDQLDDGARRGLWGLLAWTLLPNHLHVLMRLPDEPAVPLSKSLQHFKTRTAQQANYRLGRDGAFWETADHLLVIPAEEAALRRAVRYLVLDPVRASLVRVWDQWPHTWVADELWQADWEIT